MRVSPIPRPTLLPLALLAALSSTAAGPATASAQPALLLHAEAGFASPVAASPSGLGPGLAGTFDLEHLVMPAVGMIARTRIGFHEDDSERSSGQRPFVLLGGVLRFRPAARWIGGDRAGVGPWLDVGGGGGLGPGGGQSGAELGVGWSVPVDRIDLSPSLRYLRSFSRHADHVPRVVMLGVEITFLDRTPEPPVEEIAPAIATQVARRPDADGDGVTDSDDPCPDLPEDVDSFSEHIGCPDDHDFDGDAVAFDDCPFDPEDVDGFFDHDGCPDPDNDRDGFADADDVCPDAPERINGVDDLDGCPDEGLIELTAGRIDIDMASLFAGDRTYIARSSVPVLAAVVELWRQQPGWVALRVQGHAGRGAGPVSRRRAMGRAWTVLRALERLGMPRDMLIHDVDPAAPSRGPRDATGAGFTLRVVRAGPSHGELLDAPLPELEAPLVAEVLDAVDPAK